MHLMDQLRSREGIPLSSRGLGVFQCVYSTFHGIALLSLASALVLGFNFRSLWGERYRHILFQREIKKRSQTRHYTYY
jgi:hypothetical protein